MDKQHLEEHWNNLTFGENDEESVARMRELILYIAERCEGDEKFGATKLNKLLYYMDMASFRELGKPLTGVHYQRLPFGPAPSMMRPVRSQMVDEGDLQIHLTTYGRFQQERVVAMRGADLSRFTGEEMRLINNVLEELKPLNATQVSDKAHGIVWQILTDGELMPYETALIGEQTPTADDVRRAKELIKEHGWHNA